MRHATAGRHANVESYKISVRARTITFMNEREEATIKGKEKQNLTTSNLGGFLL